MMTYARRFIAVSCVLVILQVSISKWLTAKNKEVLIIQHFQTSWLDEIAVLWPLSLRKAPQYSTPCSPNQALRTTQCNMNSKTLLSLELSNPTLIEESTFGNRGKTCSCYRFGYYCYYRGMFLAVVPMAGNVRARVPRDSKESKVTFKDRQLIEQYYFRLGDREVEQTTHYAFNSITNQMAIPHLAASLIAVAAAIALKQPQKIRCYRTLAREPKLSRAG
jgi:hypothetical protein